MKPDGNTGRGNQALEASPIQRRHIDVWPPRLRQELLGNAPGFRHSAPIHVGSVAPPRHALRSAGNRWEYGGAALRGHAVLKH